MPASRPAISPLLRIIALAAPLALASARRRSPPTALPWRSHLTCNKGWSGVAAFPPISADKFGETVGSGSGLAVDPRIVDANADGYEGTFLSAADRGYNVAGTRDIVRGSTSIAVTFTPLADPTAARSRSARAASSRR
jgi:hypothetical protein